MILLPPPQPPTQQIKSSLFHVWFWLVLDMLFSYLHSSHKYSFLSFLVNAATWGKAHGVCYCCCCCSFHKPWVMRPDCLVGWIAVEHHVQGTMKQGSPFFMILRGELTPDLQFKRVFSPPSKNSKVYLLHNHSHTHTTHTHTHKHTDTHSDCLVVDIMRSILLL